MIVRDVMSRDVEYAAAGDTAQAAAVLMGEIEVGALPVGSAAHVEGVVTDRDLLYRVVAAGMDPATTPLQTILSRPVIACRGDDTLQAAMDLMAANHIRRMPVLDAAGRVEGWITLGDISRKLLVDDGALQAALARLTEPD